LRGYFVRKKSLLVLFMLVGLQTPYANAIEVDAVVIASIIVSGIGFLFARDYENKKYSMQLHIESLALKEQLKDELKDSEKCQVQGESRSYVIKNKCIQHYHTEEQKALVKKMKEHKKKAYRVEALCDSYLRVEAKQQVQEIAKNGS